MMSGHSQEVDYTFEAEEAARADALATQVDTTGKYIGKIVDAQEIFARSGTKGVLLQLETKEGQTAYTRLYTLKKGDDGKLMKLRGHSQFTAILGLLGIKELVGVPGKAQVYDDEVGGKVEKEVKKFPQVCGKQLGFLLQKRLFTVDDGSDSYGIELVGVFDAITGQTSTEKRENVPAVKVAQRLATLADKDERKAKATTLMLGTDNTNPLTVLGGF